MFTAKIVLAESPGPHSEEGMPTVIVPGKFPTKAAADEAALRELNVLKRPIGSAYYLIFDGDGNPA
jgi:hypothetical protein